MLRFGKLIEPPSQRRLLMPNRASWMFSPRNKVIPIVVPTGSGGAGAGPAIVQAHFINGDPNNAAGYNNFAFGPLEPVGAGNCLGLIIPQDTTNGITLSSISDPVNGSWSTTPALTCVGASTTTSLFLKPNCTGGQTRITVNFSGGTAGPPFVIFEASGIDQSNPYDGGHVAADQVYGGVSPITCGSFTPGHSGSLVIANFCCSTGVTASGQTSNFSPTAGFNMLSANVAWTTASTPNGLSHANSYQIQSGQSAVNPGITPTGNTTDKYNCMAFALKASAGAGTPRPSGVYIIKRFFFFTYSSPSPWVLQVPMLGNLRLAYANGGDFSSIVDSETNSWSFVPNDGNTSASASPQVWHLDNASANPNLTVTCNLNAGVAGQQNRVAFLDVIGAAASPLGANAWNSGNPIGNPQNDAPDITPTQTGSRIIVYAPAGNGPVLSFFNPSNAVFDNCSYTGELDGSSNNSGDGWGHVATTAGQVGVSQAFDWTVVAGTGVAAHAAEWKHA